MVNSTATTPSQSHGGALYYVVEVPREQYMKQCAAQAQAAAIAGGYPNPAYQAQYAAHHQQFQNVHNTTILARLNSTESGWDNPFRPGGDLSREADEIVNLIKGGKPITPTGDQSLLNGSTPKDSHAAENGGSTVVDGVATKLDSAQLQSQPNGTKSPQKGGAGGPDAATSPQKNGSTAAQATSLAPSQTAATTTTPVSNQVIPGPQSASHVVIDEKKKKKCACCVIQPKSTTAHGGLSSTYWNDFHLNLEPHGRGRLIGTRSSQTGDEDAARIGSAIKLNQIDGRSGTL